MSSDHLQAFASFRNARKSSKSMRLFIIRFTSSILGRQTLTEFRDSSSLSPSDQVPHEGFHIIFLQTSEPTGYPSIITAIYSAIRRSWSSMNLKHIKTSNIIKTPYHQQKYHLRARNRSKSRRTYCSDHPAQAMILTIPKTAKSCSAMAKKPMPTYSSTSAAYPARTRLPGSLSSKNKS